jgi:hypothetical protein
VAMLGFNPAVVMRGLVMKNSTKECAYANYKKLKIEYQ